MINDHYATGGVWYTFDLLRTFSTVHSLRHLPAPPITIAMQVDHIFIFVNSPKMVAEELLAFGLTEGSSRVHVGQGTANRKFYFENFFLEVLWVQHEVELKSPTLLPTKLWQRADYLDTHASPYGLCLVNTPDTDELFAPARPYQPAYFPAGLAIDVLAHEHNLSLPWTFRLPFKGKPAATTEPTSHRAGLRRLTQAAFGLAHYDAADPLLRQVAGQPQLQFLSAPTNTLHLTFDDNEQGKTKVFETIGLVMNC